MRVGRVRSAGSGLRGWGCRGRSAGFGVVGASAGVRARLGRGPLVVRAPEFTGYGWGTTFFGARSGEGAGSVPVGCRAGSRGSGARFGAGSAWSSWCPEGGRGHAGVACRVGPPMYTLRMGYDIFRGWGCGVMSTAWANRRGGFVCSAAPEPTNVRPAKRSTGDRAVRYRVRASMLVRKCDFSDDPRLWAVRACVCGVASGVLVVPSRAAERPGSLTPQQPPAGRGQVLPPGSMEDYVPTQRMLTRRRTVDQGRRTSTGCRR